MSLSEAFQIVATPITSHAFNADRSAVALCANNSDVCIYSRQGTDWKLEHVLTDHDKLVTSIDWAPKSNRIVTCSQDRNAYVWTFDPKSNTWSPTLVLLRINRAATCVKWSPLENKFAVASGARCISVCYFESENNWWVSKHIKSPIRSTVLSIDWHPNNVLLAAASSDMHARVFSSWIKGVDEKPAPSAWGEKLPFNTVCADQANTGGGWVKDVAFSPEGTKVAWIAQDASLSVYTPEDKTVVKVKTAHLPFNCLLWLSDDRIVAAGHGCDTIHFEAGPQNQWRESKPSNDQKNKTAGAGSVTARNIFMQMDNRAQNAGSTSTDTKLNTVHQNTITGLRRYEGNHKNVLLFSTSGIDGKIALWNHSA